MTSRIFYSWQSDLPNSTNRGFIQTALEKAVSSLVKIDGIEVSPVIDRDTMGIPGSPDIVSSIFDKIDKSQMFICDVSIITGTNNRCPEESPSESYRPSIRNIPNPNVLVELGYAMKALGPDKIIMVTNLFYGGIEQLPFDIRSRRVATYMLSPDAVDRNTERKKLESMLASGIRAILGASKPKSRRKHKPDVLDLFDLILAKIQSRSSPLAQCIAEVLPLAIKIDNKNLEWFCRHELSGYYGEKDETDRARLSFRSVPVFLSPLEIDANFPGWNGNILKALDYMRDEPGKFKPLRLLFPAPLSQLEANLPEVGGGIGHLRLHASDVFQKVVERDYVVHAYTDERPYTRLVENIRSELTTMILDVISSKTS